MFLSQFCLPAKRKCGLLCCARIKFKRAKLLFQHKMQIRQFILAYCNIMYCASVISSVFAVSSPSKLVLFLISLQNPITWLNKWTGSESSLGICFLKLDRCFSQNNKSWNFWISNKNVVDEVFYQEKIIKEITGSISV